MRVLDSVMVVVFGCGVRQNVAHTYTRTHTLTHARTHTHAHAHAHTHTHTPFTATTHIPSKLTAKLKSKGFIDRALQNE